MAENLLIIIVLTLAAAYLAASITRSQLSETVKATKRTATLARRLRRLEGELKSLKKIVSTVSIKATDTASPQDASFDSNPFKRMEERYARENKQIVSVNGQDVPVA